MLERDIKQVLEVYIASTQSEHEAPPLFLEELRVSEGAARADLVDVGRMHCYEIKSEKDSLKRLVSQGSRYIRVFDKITLVAAETHLEMALKIIPLWWGVIMVPKSVEMPFEVIRSAKSNPELVPSQLAKLLTKEECLDVLSKEGLLKGRKSLTLCRLHESIVEVLPVEKLKRVITYALQARVRIQMEVLKLDNPLL